MPPGTNLPRPRYAPNLLTPQVLLLETSHINSYKLKCRIKEHWHSKGTRPFPLSLLTLAPLITPPHLIPPLPNPINTMTPVTELAFLTLKPGVASHLSLPETEEGKAWSQALSTISQQEGYQRQRWGVTIEDEELLLLVIGSFALLSPSISSKSQIPNHKIQDNR